MSEQLPTIHLRPGGGALVQAPFHPEAFRFAMKEKVPSGSRRWDPELKSWAIDGEENRLAVQALMLRYWPEIMVCGDGHDYILDRYGTITEQFRLGL